MIKEKKKEEKREKDATPIYRQYPTTAASWDRTVIVSAPQSARQCWWKVEKRGIGEICREKTNICGFHSQSISSGWLERL